MNTIQKEGHLALHHVPWYIVTDYQPRDPAFTPHDFLAAFPDAIRLNPTGNGSDSLKKVIECSPLNEIWCIQFLHLNPDERNEPIVLINDINGAAEIYLNGLRVGQFGEWRENRAVSGIRPRAAPLILACEQREYHILAVRYSIAPVVAMPKWMQQYFVETGFTMTAYSSSDFYAYMESRLYGERMPFWLVGVVLLFLMLRHGLLYLFDKSGLLNLFISLHCFFHSLDAILTIETEFMMPTTEYFVWSWVAFKFAEAIMGIFLLAMVYEALLSTIPKRFWVYSGLALFYAFASFWDASLQSYILILVCISLVFEIPILVKKAVSLKKPGLWMIGLGASVMVFIVLITEIPAFPRDYAMGSIRLFTALQVLMYLSFPVTFSFYAAVQESLRSVLLKEQLKQLEALTEKTLLQEREKQRLIETENIRLEEMVRLRTHELEEKNEEISTQRNQLAEANQVKNEFLAIASHDLKNPLQAIMGYGSLIEEKYDRDKDLSLWASSIVRSSDKMLHLIKELLDTAAIETGNLVLRSEQHNLSELIKTVIQNNLLQASSKLITIETDIEDNLIAVFDLERIRQVADNLLSNAIKFSPQEKRIKVVLKTSTSRIKDIQAQEVDEESVDVPKPNDALFHPSLKVHSPPALTPLPTVIPEVPIAILGVIDEGQGLSEEDMALLFGRFKRLSSKPTANETSTGLGLSIAKSFVTLHGGNIWAESKGKNTGAAFWVTLPLKPR